MDVLQSLKVSGGAMMAQSQRMRAAAENLANADSIQNASGDGPYRAKQVYFKAVVDRTTGMTGVQSSVRDDMSTPLRTEYQPGSDMADPRGFVQYPNVDMTIETLNMKGAQRGYEANLAAVETAKEMAGRTLDILR